MGVASSCSLVECCGCLCVCVQGTGFAWTLGREGALADAQLMEVEDPSGGIRHGKLFLRHRLLGNPEGQSWSQCECDCCHCG